MANERIKKEAKTAGVRMWRIAEELGISPNAFSISLRHELPEKKQNEISEIIHKLQNADE